MKKSTRHIICSWILLLCFITGQYMVYAHQHYINKNTHTPACHAAKSSSQPSLTEKCALCDSMHHISMEMASYASYHTVISTAFVFKTFAYDFTSIALILSPGRAPPVVS